MDALARGEEQAGDELLLRVYEELRHLAAAHMARESPNHTLQPTALVHEAWLRLVDGTEWKWKGRAYFFASAAKAMRRILIEHARRKAAVKHGGALQRVDIEGLELAQATADEKILLMEEAPSRATVRSRSLSR